MKRRSFLKMLFGGAVAAVAAPVVAPAIPNIFPAGGTITVDLKQPELICRPYVYAKEFDLDTDVRFIMNVAPNFVMDQIGLYFDPKMEHKSLVDFYNEVCIDFSIDDRRIMQQPAWLLAGVGMDSMHRLAIPMIADNRLSVDFNAVESWKPLPGIKGQIVVQGVQRYNLNHF